MIKPKKDPNRIEAQDAQTLGDKEISVSKAVDFYNNFVRKEGEKVLSEQEYRDMVKRKIKEGQELADKFNKMPDKGGIYRPGDRLIEVSPGVYMTKDELDANT